MIYTVTLNPSIDYVADTDMFTAGKLNRLTGELFLPGGKGNNVSAVLKSFGIESTTLGFIAGFTGEQIDRLLREQGIRTDFIRLAEGNSRINMKILSRSDGEETEINGIGPVIGEKEMEELFHKLQMLGEWDSLILAGSIPPTLPDTVYEQLCEAVSNRGVRIVVDAEKKLLERVLRFRPYLIKPNHHELGEMFGVKITTKEAATHYAKKLQLAGARNVMVSMAADGAVFVAEDGQLYEMDPPEGTVVNSVGAGDSMVAGFLAAVANGLSIKEAFRQAVFAGSACAFGKGLPTAQSVRELMEQDRERI